jgi:hypothetical protein
MRHVKQKDKMGCGLAVTAMVSGVHYAAVRAAAEEESLWSPVNGMVIGRLRRLLQTFTGTEWIWRRPTYLPLHKAFERARLSVYPWVVILIKEPGRKRYHWILVRGSRHSVWDPMLPGPQTVTAYESRDWRVEHILVPCADL